MNREEEFSDKLTRLVVDYSDIGDNALIAKLEVAKLYCFMLKFRDGLRKTNSYISETFK